MKRWEDRSDVNKAEFCALIALFAGCAVVFLPKFIPPTGFINTAFQFVAMVLGLLSAFLSGIHLHRAFPDDLDMDR